VFWGQKFIAVIPQQSHQSYAQLPAALTLLSGPWTLMRSGSLNWRSVTTPSHPSNQRGNVNKKYSHTQNLHLTWRWLATVFYDTIEIGSLGHYLKSSVQAFASTIPNARRQDLTKLITSLAKTAIGCSATIFHARNSPIWEKPKPLYTPLFDTSPILIFVLYHRVGRLYM